MLLPLSAASDPSLRRMADQLRQTVEEQPLASIAATLSRQRTLPVRAAVVASTSAEAAAALGRLAETGRLISAIDALSSSKTSGA